MFVFRSMFQEFRLITYAANEPVTGTVFNDLQPNQWLAYAQEVALS